MVIVQRSGQIQQNSWPHALPHLARRTAGKQRLYCQQRFVVGETPGVQLCIGKRRWSNWRVLPSPGNCLISLSDHVQTPVADAGDAFHHTRTRAPDNGTAVER